jgi:hypothetical protein
MSNFSRWQAGTAALLAFSLTTAAVSPLVSSAPAFAQIVNFSDVPDGYWAKDFITEIVKMGIMDGFPNGTFNPDGPVTRAQFAAILARANREEYWDKPNIDENQVFSVFSSFYDVSSRYWAASDIRKAVKTGFMKGYPGGFFNPEKSITFEDIFWSLVRGLGYKSKQDPEKILSGYDYASSIAGYARASFAAALENQLVVSRRPERPCPSCNASRADVAAAVYQGLVREGKAPAINSPYIVKLKPAAPTP